MNRRPRAFWRASFVQANGGPAALVLPGETMLGALCGYVSDPAVSDFQRWAPTWAFCRRWRSRCAARRPGTRRWLAGRLPGTTKSCGWGGTMKIIVDAFGGDNALGRAQGGRAGGQTI